MLKENKFKIFHLSPIEIKYMILVWLLWTSTAPFEFYSIIPYHPYKYLVVFVAVIMLIILFRNGIKKSSNIIFFIILIQAFYSVLSIPIHIISLNSFTVESSLIYINLLIQLTVVFICFTFINSLSLVHKLAVSLIPVMIIMAGFGMLNLLLGVLVNIQPISFTAISDHRDISNYLLTFSSSVSDLGFASIIRSSGYFDEPGTFAFYITVTLLINKMYGGSKLSERLLVGFGLCTMSLAFFISVILYYIIYGILEGHIKVIIWLSVIVFSLFVAIVEYRDKSDITRVVYELTVYRVMTDDITDDRLFHGDNRSDNLTHAKQAFLQAPFFGHGMTAHTNEKSEFYGKLCCNPLHPFATEGLVGTFVFFLVFIYWGFYIVNQKKFDYISAGAWIIIFVNMLQRPGTMGGSFGYFVFIFLLEASRWRNMQRRLLF